MCRYLTYRLLYNTCTIKYVNKEFKQFSFISKYDSKCQRITKNKNKRLNLTVDSNESKNF